MQNGTHDFYGTAWKEENTRRLTSLAIEHGFRSFDTANQRKHYHEAQVGEALKYAWDTSQVTRDDVYIQTKWTHRRGQDHRLPYDDTQPFNVQVRQSVASSLSHLHTNYLDSFLLHGPMGRDGLSDADWAVWRTMEALHDEVSLNRLGRVTYLIGS